MTTIPPANSPPIVDKRPSYQLTVNSYDRTASLIVALLVLVGCAVLGLAVVFFTGKFTRTIEPIPIVPTEASSPSANQGIAEEPDPPGAEDAPELIEPQLQDTLETLANAVSEKQVMLSDEMIDAQNQASRGKGLGDKRMMGSAGDGVVERVPRWERWKIRFEPASSKEFASWLDFHKIELGVLGRDNQVHYGYDFSKATPKVRAGEPLKEIRGYTSAADGPMPKLTIDLARKADVARLGNVVLLFYPKEVEDMLWIMENKYFDNRDVNMIRETVFTVERDGSGFKFSVISQKYF
jgi:hypothetical protein